MLVSRCFYGACDSDVLWLAVGVFFGLDVRYTNIAFLVQHRQLSKRHRHPHQQSKHPQSRHLRRTANPRRVGIFPVHVITLRQHWRQ